MEVRRAQRCKGLPCTAFLGVLCVMVFFGATVSPQADNSRNRQLLSENTTASVNSSRGLPSCMLSSVITPLHLEKPGRHIDIFGSTHAGSDSDRLLRPPSRTYFSYREKQTSLNFVKREMSELYADASLIDFLIPDRLSFMFIADEATWELESLRDHLAPYILRVRDERNRSRIVMTFHLAYPTMLADPAAAATTLAETVRCIRDHLSLWYDGSTIERLFGGAHGSVIVSERRVSALRLHAFLSALEAVRLGNDASAAVGTLRLPNLVQKLSKRRKIDSNPSVGYEEASRGVEPLDVPALNATNNAPFMPIIKTVSGISDEELIGDSIVKYSARWAQLGGRRTYLRQYAPKLLRLSSNASAVQSSSETLSIHQHVNVVLSGFRAFNASVMLTPSISPTIIARTYLWSFLGKLRNDDRKRMISTFTAWSGRRNARESCTSKNHFFCCASRNLVTESPQAIYSKSIFVPIGRGQLSLDCYRIYEAALCGAIPVISGAHYAEEFWHTFAHYATSRGRLPPFVFAHSWDAAVVELDRLLAAPEELSRMQGDCVRWVFDNFRFLQKSYLGV